MVVSAGLMNDYLSMRDLRSRGWTERLPAAQPTLLAGALCLANRPTAQQPQAELLSLLENIANAHVPSGSVTYALRWCEQGCQAEVWIAQRYGGAGYAGDVCRDPESAFASAAAVAVEHIRAAAQSALSAAAASARRAPAETAAAWPLICPGYAPGASKWGAPLAASVPAAQTCRARLSTSLPQQSPGQLKACSTGIPPPYLVQAEGLAGYVVLLYNLPSSRPYEELTRLACETLADSSCPAPWRLSATDDASHLLMCFTQLEHAQRAAAILQGASFLGRKSYADFWTPQSYDAWFSDPRFTLVPRA